MSTPRKLKTASPPGTTKVAAPLVGVIMGSKSDWDTMRHAAEILDAVPGSARAACRVRSSHAGVDVRVRPHGGRTWPAGHHRRRGRRGASARHGRRANHVARLGVPVQSRALQGLDSLLSIVQMPAGVPVGTLAIGEAGATNAALLALRILAIEQPRLREQLQASPGSAAAAGSG